MTCENCGREDAREVGAMTAYYWDGTGEDPNRPLQLCPECEEEYCEHWTDRWQEYYEGQRC